MVRNKKPTGTATSIPLGLLISVLISMFITLVGATILSLLIEKEIIKDIFVGYGTMTILFCASATGASTAISKIKHRKILMSLLSGIIYIFVLLGITAFWFEGMYEGVLPTLLIVLSGCISVGIIRSKDLRSRGETRRINAFVKINKKSYR